LKGSSDSGRIESCTCSYGTSWADPQKSHRLPTFAASNTEIAWQLWHRADDFPVSHPRDSAGSDRSAAARSCSMITVLPSRVCSTAGDVVPQNGQTSACFVAFQWASAPQAGQ
jgi:hypothetical protein